MSSAARGAALRADADAALVDLTAIDPSLRIDGHLPECRSQHRRGSNRVPDCDWCLWAIDGAGIRPVIDAIGDATALSTDHDRRRGEVSVPWVVATTDLLAAELPRPDDALLTSTGELLDRLHRVLAERTKALGPRVDAAVASGGPLERRCLATAGPLAAAALQRPEHHRLVEQVPDSVRRGLRHAGELLSSDHQTAGLLPLVELRHWDGLPTLRTQPAWAKRAEPPSDGSGAAWNLSRALADAAGPAPGSLEALVVESAVGIVTDLLDEVALELAGDLSDVLPRTSLPDRRNRTRLSDRTRLLTWRIARIDWHLTFVDTGRADCWTHREGETGRHGGTGSDDDADGKLIVPWTVALAIDECERAGLVSATHQAGDPVDRTT